MEDRRARFGGEVVAILWHTLHPSAFFLGAACAALVAGGVFLMGALQLEKIAPIVLQALVFLFVIRIAQNTARSEAMGGFFGSQGSNWPDAFGALGRLLLLNLIWAIPLVLLGGALSQLPGQLLMGGGVGGPALLLLMAMALLPPLFLVGAVGADRLAEICDPGHWQRLFAGRTPEVVALFSVYLGGAMLSGTAAWLAAMAIGNGKQGLTLFLSMAAGSYALGIALLLLGRLVGGFLRTGEEGVPAPAHPLDLPPVDELPVVDPNGERGPMPARAAAPSAHPDKPAHSLDDLLASVAPEPGGSAERPAVTGNSLIEILRANDHQAEEDPEGALAELEELLAQRGPQPMLLTRIAILEHQLGREGAGDSIEEAIGVARRGANPGLLAELHTALGDEMVAFELSDEEWQRVAQSHQTLARWDQAVAVYGLLLQQNPRCMPALKGMIQVAEAHLKEEDGAERAVGVYDRLEELSPDHPFEEFVERGRETAERRLSRAR